MIRSIALVSLALAACAREPLPEICPDVEPGTLVISELRGDQDGFEAQWIEIHNTSSSTVDLMGLLVRFRIDNDVDYEIVDVLIRDDVELEAGGYLSIGARDGDFDWLDYVAVEVDSPFGKLESDEVANGIVELEGCDDELLDSVTYRSLPKFGTQACGNAASPASAETNDHTSSGCWCTDEAPGGAQGLAGFGTPGEPNRCP